VEIRTFAERIFFGESLEAKLKGTSGTILTDHHPGAALRWSDPTRPVQVHALRKRSRKRLPSAQAMEATEQRVRVLHTFANHELMAIELMAWALLAFPDASPTFRRGVLAILEDEQRHFRMYAERIVELGACFGDLGVNHHFLRCGPDLTTPMKWVCAMNLTFEQANLDLAPVFADRFRIAGDERSAKIMDVIEEDEIRHVGFGARWLKTHTPVGRSTFEFYVENLTHHNSPERARGLHFFEASRSRAGLDEEFISQMKAIGERK
jgi:uncharacterized ferritin-like protein (DUF455 family)